MKKTLAILLLSILNVSAIHAISKEEFLKLPDRKKSDFAIMAGISSEYAIPDEEFMELSFEVRKAIGFEKGWQRVQYVVKNIGKKEGELDISRLYDLGMQSEVGINKERLVDYLTICGIYYADCENHFKAAPYCRKHYLEWKKHEMGQPALWQSDGGGDSAPNGLYDISGILEDAHMYKDLASLYTDYSVVYWKRAAEIECRLVLPPDPACPQKWLKNNEGYQGFLKEWAEVKKLAKTTKPKPLSVQVQTHEDFYSNDVKKVLGAVEYYAKNRVKFMVEKAAKHKDGVVVKKAIEYLENWKE